MFQPKIFEVKGDRNCPVQLYLLFKNKRPDLSPQGRFYLGINHKVCSDDEPWYMKTPMGKNTLGSIAKTISEKAGFCARHTNHSGRKTAITKLLEAGCPPTEVAQLSGHKNIQSLNHYHTMSIEKQRNMSSIIHKTSTVTSRIDTEMNDGLDEELVASSQEIESTLHTIHSYEEVQNNPVQHVIDLPIAQSPGGSLRMNPMSLFNGCTFNSSITINMK
ncbi:uncharacterized protein LOC132736855 [Ruditapes philippinarum]|uniref:uncharacterized protein LOC132736855 n=1 Tax=Ruditapes philippinarum TaxID=129788 RepID=UPI00295BA9E2|nr:uncharacterized protein LOC132736855 [Ruditapes philippinarum]